jgi:hypothetical protein
VARWEAENTTTLPLAHADIDGLVRKVTLIEGELAEARRAQEMAEGKFHSLSDAMTKGVWRLVVSRMEHREQFEEISLLQAWGSELFLTIVGPPRERNLLSTGMRETALHHTKMDGGLAVLQAMVSSAVESVLGRLLDEAF